MCPGPRIAARGAKSRSPRVDHAEGNVPSLRGIQQGGTPDTVTVPAGGYLTADVLQVGSGTAGSNLTVQVVLNPAAL